MTRDEQIKKAANEYGKEYVTGEQYHGFLAGAKWADENPPDKKLIFPNGATINFSDGINPALKSTK